MGCATSLVKFLLFMFNFLFVVGGICLVAFGAMAFNGYNMYAEFIKTGPYQAPPIGMMVIGGVIVLIAFMGCCGVLRESRCMMMTYATFLIVLLVLEIIIAVLIYQYQDDFKGTLKEGMQASIPKYNDDSNPQIKEAWDTVQSRLKCCGAENYKDWKSEGVDIPESCCKNAQPGCVPDNIFSATISAVAELSIYTEGCVDKSFEDLKTDYGIYGSAIIAGVELLGVIFGCCLGARFGRKRYSV